MESIRTAETTGSDPVAEFAARIGLPEPLVDDDAFWIALAARFGAVAERVRAAHALAMSEQDPAGRRARIQDVYDLKNTSLELSLAVTAQFRGVLHRSLMLWLARWTGETPKRVLDVGCDVGVVTCCLASRFPEATVHGIDTSRTALRRAAELARAAGIENVRFEHADARTYADAVADGYFDAVFAVNAHEYAVGFPPTVAYYTLATATEPARSEAAAAVAQGLGRMLRAEAGVFVSVEQFASDAQQYWWLRTLNDAGLSIEWDRAVQLRTDLDAEAPGVVPLVVASRRSPLRVATRDDFLASAVAREIASRERSLGRRDVYERELAEALFEAVDAKRLVRGVEVVYAMGVAPGLIPVAERLEVWEAGPLLLVFSATNDGLRRTLAVRSRADRSRVFDEMDERARRAVDGFRATLRVYDSIAERDSRDKS